MISCPTRLAVNRKRDPDAVLRLRHHQSAGMCRATSRTAFVTIRASVYETPDLRMHTPTPELERTGRVLSSSKPNHFNTTVTIESIGAEGRESLKREGDQWVRPSASRAS